MIIPINRALEYATRQLNSREQKIVRKFIERHNNFAIMKYASIDNLHKSIIYRKFFLDEIDKRYESGDMQFLTAKTYGIIRHYIKSCAAGLQRSYIRHLKSGSENDNNLI
jgi:hypothetical protein